MTMKTIKSSRYFSLVLIGIFTAGSLLTTEKTFAGHRNQGWSRNDKQLHRPGRQEDQRQDKIKVIAQRPGKPKTAVQGPGRVVVRKPGRAVVQKTAITVTRRSSPAVSHRPGRVVARLPANRHSIKVRGKHYFFDRGVFYRERPFGFVVVSAPIGAVVTSLPWGYSRLAIGGASYFVYDGVYYRPAPAGYVVVTPPENAAVVYNQENSPAVQEQAAPQGEVIVTAAGLNLRVGPGLQHRAIDQVQRGDILAVIGKADGWLYVKLPSGQSGWVMSAFTDPGSPPASG